MHEYDIAQPPEGRISLMPPYSQDLLAGFFHDVGDAGGEGVCPLVRVRMIRNARADLGACFRHL